MADWLDPVRRALDQAPAPVQFFFRDDDAGWSDDLLHRLLDLFERRAVAIDLAVIPGRSSPRRHMRCAAAARPSMAGWACISTAWPTSITSPKGASANSGRAERRPGRGPTSAPAGRAWNRPWAPPSTR